MSKKRLIVFNPLIPLVIGDEKYQEMVKQLEEEGSLVRDAKKGAPYVLDQMQKYTSRHPGPFLDSRCPEVVKMIENEFPDLTDFLVKLNPILISGALIECEETGVDPSNLLIVTPCSQLLDHSSFQGLIFPRGITLKTWKDFNEEMFNIPGKRPEETPVPVGFFNDILNNTIKITSKTGEGEIRKLLKNIDPTAENFFCELLLCPGGCHCGDGLV